MEVDLAGIACYLTHYPTEGRRDRFNIVGHVHSAWKVQLNMLNVSVDAHHFYPFDTADLPFMLKAICEVYDRDVWAAYLTSNESWKTSRGKPTTYFTRP